MMKDAKHFDVVIIGAGLAGLQCAKLLAEANASVLLVDRKHDLTEGIHTTGIFVRKTFEDFSFPAGTLGRPIRNVTLYSPYLRSLDLESKHDEFRVGKMGELYKGLLDDCLRLGVRSLGGTRYISASTAENMSVVRLQKAGKIIDVETTVLVGADGAMSRVACDLGLDENKEWIVGYEEVFRQRSRREPRLHCFLDAELAPGYLAWIADDGEEVHVGVGGYAADFDPRRALELFKEKTRGIFDLTCEVPRETRGGRIPVGGILRNIANKNGLLIGDAAGAVSPLTAGGLDPCLRLSSFAAQVIAERLRHANGEMLLRYSGDLFRARFISRLWMRRIIAFFENQTIIDLGFRILCTRPGVGFVKHVFFGRGGSFPEIERITVSDPATVGR